MSPIIAIVVLVLLSVCAGQILESIAQPGARAPQESMRGTRMVEGRIADEKGHWIVLSNGTLLEMPDNLVQRLELKPGTFIRAMYEAREGQKFATSTELGNRLEDPE